MAKRRPSASAPIEAHSAATSQSASLTDAASQRFLPAFRVLICGRAEFRQAAEYVDAIQRAFRGAVEESGYLASGDDLGVDVTWFTHRPDRPPAAHLEGALHTLVVVLASESMAMDDQFRSWLEVALELIQASRDRHRLIVLAETEVTVDSFQAKQSRLASAQFTASALLGEQATRPPRFALIVLNESCRQIARVLDASASRYQLPAMPHQLFVSHAKKDGLPLATAIRHELESLPRVTTFYDASSLQFTDDWSRDLERGVKTSVVVVLRTDEYDRRPFCEKELRWADAHGCPVIVVDAANRAYRPRTNLPFSDAPQYYLRDGNVLRVLAAAIRERLRAALLLRKVVQFHQSGVLTEPCWVLHRAPSVASVRRACEHLNERSFPSSSSIIVYPDPVMVEDDAFALSLLADLLKPGTRLLTARELPELVSSGGVVAPK